MKISSITFNIEQSKNREFIYDSYDILVVAAQEKVTYLFRPVDLCIFNERNANINNLIT